MIQAEKVENHLKDVYEANGRYTLIEAEALIELTARQVSADIAPDATVLIAFSDRYTLRFGAAHMEGTYEHRRSPNLGGAVVDTGVVQFLVFQTPIIRALLSKPDLLKRIAAEEAVHIKHHDHGPGFRAEMERLGYPNARGTTMITWWTGDPVLNIVLRIQSWLERIPPAARIMDWHDHNIFRQQATRMMNEYIDSME